MKATTNGWLTVCPQASGKAAWKFVAVEPEDLDEEVMCHNPGLVLCSRRSRVVESWPCAWVVLYPDGETRAMVSIAGRRRTVTADLPFASLLSLIDETEHLTLTGG